jgi:Pyruvate/2-oxoacid:ferredoxin oxidoreductase gamma subunit
MLGALAKTTNWVKLDSLAKAVEDKWSGRLAASNITAIREAYDATEIYEV